MYPNWSPDGSNSWPRPGAQSRNQSGRDSTIPLASLGEMPFERHNDTQRTMLFRHLQSDVRHWRLRHFLVVGLLVLWASFIFATSSMVIGPDKFFEWVSQNIVVNEDLFSRFQLFWVFSWFAIVKGGHVAEFAILFLLCVESMSRLRGKYTTSTLLFSISLCVAYAISDEMHQANVPGRYGTVDDVLIDGIGVLIAGFWSHREYSSGRIKFSRDSDKESTA